MTLDQLQTGSAGVVSAVLGEGTLRMRLLDMGFTPGTTITVLSKAPLGDPLRITLRGYELTLRKKDAAEIVVVKGTEIL